MAYLMDPGDSGASGHDINHPRLGSGPLGWPPACGARGGWAAPCGTRGLISPSPGRAELVLFLLFHAPISDSALHTLLGFGGGGVSGSPVRVEMGTFWMLLCPGMERLSL